MNIFQKASRLKLRFSTRLGLITVEDLWDLPLTTTVSTKVSLDQIAMETFVRLDAPVVTSFVNQSTLKSYPEREADELRMEILKFIIDVKKQENADRLAASEKAAKKQKLLNLLAKRQEENLDNLSEDEILQQLSAM